MNYNYLNLYERSEEVRGLPRIFFTFRNNILFIQFKREIT